MIGKKIQTKPMQVTHMSPEVWDKLQTVKLMLSQIAVDKSLNDGERYDIEVAIGTLENLAK